MDKKWDVVMFRNKGLTMPQLHVIDMKPKPPLVAFDDLLPNTETTIPHHNLPLPVYQLCHFQHRCRCLRVPRELCWKHKMPVGPLWFILPLDKLHSPHNQPAVISVSNQVVLVAKQARLAGTHMYPGQNLLSQELIDLSGQLRNEG